MVALVVGAVLLVVAGIGVGFQVRETYRAPAAGPAGAGAASAPVTVADGQPISWGPADAPATVDLYVDFHCPACGAFEETYGPLLAGAVDEGRIRLRTFPLAFIDAGSAAAANGYACAAEAGFGEAYYAALFANSDLRWSSSQLVTLFEQVSGSPSADVAACIEDRQHETWVTSLDRAAEKAGVQGTPTLLVDGAPVDTAALTPETLTTTIKEAART